MSHECDGILSPRTSKATAQSVGSMRPHADRHGEGTNVVGLCAPIVIGPLRPFGMFSRQGCALFVTMMPVLPNAPALNWVKLIVAGIWLDGLYLSLFK